MKNLLLSEAIGDIAGVPYEFGNKRTKDYDSVNLTLPSGTYSDDTVCTFAVAEALIKNIDVALNLYKRCRMEPRRGYGGKFRHWVNNPKITPAYGSWGNGSAMRVSSVGWLADTPGECLCLATKTALPTHDHPYAIKGAFVAAEAIRLIRKSPTTWTSDIMNLLRNYYPSYSNMSYELLQEDYKFDSSCEGTVPAVLIALLESNSYSDALKLAIALGGDADTLAAIIGPMAYALYKNIPQELVDNAVSKLPDWMLEVNREFDKYVES